ncbi:MAG: hypothetical protein J6X66_06280 [Lachnospiraceae bacterium]|nr:hypothetical protein [Lachnospiraceae bacterium]
MDNSESKKIQDEKDHLAKQEQHNTEMARTEKAQLRFQKLSFVMSILSCLFMAAMLIIVICLCTYIVPKVNTIYNSTMITLANMEKITNDLNEANLSGTVKNINDLTLQATGDLHNTMEKLNSVDLDTLNDSIKDLHDIIEPMAKLFSLGR